MAPIDERPTSGGVQIGCQGNLLAADGRRRGPVEVSDASHSSDDLFDSEDEYSDVSGSLEEDISWIEWFCGIKGNEYLVEIDEEYIRDDFNLTGLHSIVPYYDQALDIVLDNDEESLDAYPEAHQQELEQSAHLLYGLVHSRFILTNRGIHLMNDKYQENIYGSCPNTFCGGQHMMPIGLSDYPSQDTAKVFCPKCNELYLPRFKALSALDGSYFGTTFAHMFFLQNDHLVVKTANQYYVPRIYGFKVHRNVRDRLRCQMQ